MKIKVKTPELDKEIETSSKKVKKLLEELEINPVSHVVSINGELAVEEDEINEGDSVKIQTVVSGG